MTFQGTVTPCFLYPLKIIGFQSCLVGDTIKVYVGEKAKRYSVHEALLTRYEWFRKQILSASNVATQGSITLRAEDPKVFELLISWLYRKKLKAISTTDENIYREEAALYVDLYLRASEWDIVELQNTVMDRLRARKAPFNLYSPRFVNQIYESTNPQSPLRSYIVDNFLYKARSLHEDTSLPGPIVATPAQMLKPKLTTLLILNRSFMVDCCETLFQLCTKSEIRDPDAQTGCQYHKHKEGEQCGLGNG